MDGNENLYSKDEEPIVRTMKVSDLPEEVQKGLAEALTGEIDVNTVKERLDAVKDVKSETEQTYEQAKDSMRDLFRELERKTYAAEKAHMAAAAVAGVEDAGIITTNDIMTDLAGGDIAAEAAKPIEGITAGRSAAQSAAEELGGAIPEEFSAPDDGAQTSGQSFEDDYAYDRHAEKKLDEETLRIREETQARVRAAIREGERERRKGRSGRHRPYLAILLLLAIVILAAITAVLRAGRREEEALPDPEAAALEEIPSGTITVPTNAPLELNAVPELNNFFRNYYNALTNYDEEVLKAANPALEKTDLVRMQAISDYIANYPVVDVYTKPGPTPESFVAYVYTRVKFADYAKEVPGLQTMYICSNPDGTYYINNNNESEDISNYIKKISTQDDVAELSSRVTEEYNALLAEGNDLRKFTEDLQAAIELRIGNLMAIESGHNIGEVTVEETPQETEPEASAEESEDTQDAEESETEEPTEEPSAEAQTETAGAEGEALPAGTKAKAKEAVRIRTAPQDEADSIGTVYPGFSLDATELRDGWLTVTFEGKTGYVKEEYFELNGN